MYDSGQIDFDGDQGSGFGGGMDGVNVNDIFSMFMGGGGMGGGMGGMGGMPGFFSSGGRGGRGGQTFEFRMG